MEVRLSPNSTRPGVGLKPRRESQRPMLPQHSRHCPVLEAGSAVGYMCYPPLEPHETYHVEYLGDGKFRFVFYAKNASGKMDALFSIVLQMPAGSAGMIREEVTFLTKPAVTDRANALLIMRTFIVPEDMGTPSGALALRGAWNFHTPEGWDTLYAPIFNMVERPVAPMLVVRVETDWYAHDTEFRYVMEPGEGISGSSSMPIGQVLFLPREEVIMRETTPEELAALRASKQDFNQHKVDIRLTTPYGLTYSPHYLRESRARKDASKGLASSVPEERAEERTEEA
jgi:hypothetical protein